MRKTVTVAIPVYNGEKYIIEALNSIISQTLKVDYILVCDNCSTDNTTNIVEQFFKEHNEIMTKLVVNEENIGAENNFNKCMELCETDFIILLGSDDILKPECVEKQIKFFTENPDLAIVGGYVDFIDANGALIRKALDISTYIFDKGDILGFVRQTNMYMLNAAVMLNLKLTKQVGLWDTKYFGSDERYYAKVLTRFPIARIGESLAYQRIHSNQEVRNENTRFSVRKRHFKANIEVSNLETDPVRRSQTKGILKKWVTSYCISISRLESKDGSHYFLALRYWFYGLWNNPLYFIEIYVRKYFIKYQKLIGLLQKNLNSFTNLYLKDK